MNICFTKGIFYKLNQFFIFQESHSNKFSRQELFEVVLLFESEEERMEFKEFIMNNWYNRKEYLKMHTCQIFRIFLGTKRGHLFKNMKMH